MFVPEMYGLEHEVPLGCVVRATADRFFLRRRVRVLFRDGDRECDVSLFLKRPDEFLRLVPSGALPVGPTWVR
jgi:hypothetical protein